MSRRPTPTPPRQKRTPPPSHCSHRLRSDGSPRSSVPGATSLTSRVLGRPQDLFRGHAPATILPHKHVSLCTLSNWLSSGVSLYPASHDHPRCILGDARIADRDHNVRSLQAAAGWQARRAPANRLNPLHIGSKQVRQERCSNGVASNGPGARPGRAAFWCWNPWVEFYFARCEVREEAADGDRLNRLPLGLGLRHNAADWLGHQKAY
jgi:hypothetical protein